MSKTLDLTKFNSNSQIQALGSMPYVNASYFTKALKSLDTENPVEWSQLDDLILTFNFKIRQQISISVEDGAVKVELGVGVIAKDQEALESLDPAKCKLIRPIMNVLISPFDGEEVIDTWKFSVTEWRRQLCNVIAYGQRNRPEGQYKLNRHMEGLFDKLVQTSFEKVLVPASYEG